MKKIVVLGLAILVAVSTIAVAQNLPIITVVNNTGTTVWYLYISTSANTSWGDDLLGDGTLMNGASYDVRLSYPLNVQNRYDVRIIDRDGNTYVKMNQQVSAGTRIVFTASDITQRTSSATGTSANGPSVTIVNNTGYPIQGVNISSTADDSWGPNLLASGEIITNGSSKIFVLQYPLTVVNRYDLRIVDTDGDAYTKMDVLVSQGLRIVFTINDFTGH